MSLTEREKHIGRLVNRLDFDTHYQEYKSGIEPTNDVERYNIMLCKDLEYVLDRLNKLEKGFSKLEEELDNQITFCSLEAQGTVNNKMCWMAVNYLKSLLEKVKEYNKE